MPTRCSVFYGRMCTIDYICTCYALTIDHLWLSTHRHDHGCHKLMSVHSLTHQLSNIVNAFMISRLQLASVSLRWT